MRVQCIGIDEDIGTDEVRKIQDALEQFATACHLAFIWHSAVMNARDGIRSHLAKSVERDARVAIVGEEGDGAARVVRTRVQASEAVDSLSEGQAFEQRDAGAFVISVFSAWEASVRPTVAQALQVPAQAVTSDLMGDWRLLRNWLVHPHAETEQRYFGDAKILPRLVGSKRGHPTVTTSGVRLLVEQLNSLTVVVNPMQQEPLLHFVEVTRETWEKIQRTLGPNERIVQL